ncbi:iron complex outermembrane receptor protein [Mucilaginibacter sp. SG538B]|uniref:SusC/RagA family TonB-linked outer membrane protein n=1 Tax=Mucilaginibacter sp. SG538B TaxID=2587021 RepID=UPI00159DACAF|nr:SusC/RagA family TonB-linked outer membrane protein [Mucilaginibacter sp. SG538B]NVM63465.1 iron complex outermembrane receptor protein [Mucilaginibacter sp. SG538B]
MQIKHLLNVCFFAVFLFLMEPAMAQNKIITGKVTDKKDGSPLIGVSVVTAVGAQGGAITATDGSYKISVPANTASLTFTYVGFLNATVPLNGRTSVDVQMEEANRALNEVVVIGYGTQKVKDATGSVATLGTKDFNKGVISTPDQLLQGRISGVQVTPSSGEPGAGAAIAIRGAGSIRSGDGPLYVIDGIPIDNSGGTSGSYGVGAGSSSARNPLAFLNPADIENISVLKDASSAAIYGARGANGVILITTRKGRKGQGIQFSSNTSVSTPAKRYDVLGRDAFLKAVAAVGANAGPVADGGVDYGGNTNWQDQIFRSPVSQNYNLSFGGASKDNTGTFRASLGYDDQQGIVRKSGLKRLNARINASQSFLNDRLKFDLQSTYSNVKNQYAPVTNNAGFNGSLIGAAIQLNPTAPVFDSQGRYFDLNGYNDAGYPNGNSFRNPVSLLNQIDDRDNINRYLNNLTLTLKLFAGISYKGNFGADISRGVRKTFYDPKIVGFTDAIGIRQTNFPSPTGNGTAIITHNEVSNYTTEHTLNYDKKWKDGSSITGLVGYSYQTFKNFARNEFGFGTSTPGVLVKNYNDFKTHLPYPVGDSSSYKLQSYFARVNYSYKDRYILTGTIRRDGSSRFGDKHKYGNFPAVAAKWRITNEEFMPKGGFFDDLSLRLNYGKTGNQEIPVLGSEYLWQILNFSGSATGPLHQNNPDLKWQTNITYGAGLDFSIIKGRLNGSVDYFNKSIRDLLFLQDLPQPTAAPQLYRNLDGDVINKGVEVGLNFAAVQGKDFSWDVAYNMTFISNTLKNFKNYIVTGNIDGQGLSGAYAQLITNGVPLFTFNMPNYAGLDKNGFGIYPQGIDSFSLQGSPNPKFTASLTNNFGYKNWTLSFFLNAATGFYIYNNTANAFFYKGNLLSGRNVTKDVAATNESPLNSGEVSTRFLEKGDFLRLSNATLGYTFPIKSNAIKTLRVSFTGQNLFLITNYSGLDPEVNTDKQRNDVASKGIDYTSYPKARIFTLGVNASF